jgi:hypothetical protein
MNCEVCSLPIEGQATAAVPCCERIYHTSCLVKESIKAGYNLLPLRCGCGIFHFNESYQQFSSYHQLPQIDVNAFVENEENRTQLKKLKEKALAAKKARSALNTILREKRVIFRNNVKPYSDSIKAIGKETTNSIKNTEQWKAASKTMHSYTTSVNKFTKDHKLSHHSLCSLLGSSIRRYRYRRFRGTSLLGWVTRLGF